MSSPDPHPDPDLPVLPFARPSAVDVAPLLVRLQAEAPVARVRTPLGDEAWLVTGYREVRSLFSDERLGRSHPDPEHAPRASGSWILNALVNRHRRVEEEHARHARMRALLSPQFSPRRMQALEPRVEALVRDLLDRIEAAGPPVDLHQALSEALSVLVICELLGVPPADRDRFAAWSAGLADHEDAERSSAAAGSLYAYLQELVQVRRADPGEDVISHLASLDDETVTDMSIAGLSMFLLFAGHVNTVAHIDHGVLVLLLNPGQRDLLVADPAVAVTAVEEILRTSVPDDISLQRYAHADVEVAGTPVRTGEAVLLSVAAANRDGAVFADPHRVDVTRQPNPHLAFGHGNRFCLGAALARVELQAVFRQLFRRFPDLRLAVPLERLVTRAGHVAGGVVELPVTW